MEDKCLFCSFCFVRGPWLQMLQFKYSPSPNIVSAIPPQLLPSVGVILLTCAPSIPVTNRRRHEKHCMVLWITIVILFLQRIVCVFHIGHPPGSPVTNTDRFMFSKGFFQIPLVWVTNSIGIINKQHSGFQLILHHKFCILIELTHPKMFQKSFVLPCLAKHT